MPDEGRVASVAEIGGDWLVGSGQGLVAVAAMHVGVDDGRIDADHHSRAIGRADRIGANGVVVLASLSGESVEGRRLEALHAVAG